MSQPQAWLCVVRFGVVVSCGPGTPVTPCFSPVVASRFSAAHLTSDYTSPRDPSTAASGRNGKVKTYPNQVEGGRTNSDATIMGSEHRDFVKSGRPLTIVLSDVFLKGFGLSVFRRVERV